MEWNDIKDHIPNHVLGVFSRQNVQKLLEDEKIFRAARENWEKSDVEQTYLNISSTKKNFDKAVKGFESRLTQLLNTHTKVFRITVYFKRWWNKKVAQVRKT